MRRQKSKILIGLVFEINTLVLGTAMETQNLYINEVPAVIWGSLSSKMYLYIHGQGGNKEEGKLFAEIATKYGYQVLSIDLPEHGERENKSPSLEPWNVVPELSCVMKFCKQHWEKISLFANSIGAWFSMLAFSHDKLQAGLFVSPVVDMVELIYDMMTWANVSELQLEKEQEIPTTFGQTLSWKYLQYAKEHLIKQWNTPTKILYGKHDALVKYFTIKDFCKMHQCELTVMQNGEHWFHTKQQLDVLAGWADRSILTEHTRKNTEHLFTR